MDIKFAPDRIEHWPLDRLVPYARNARTHGDDQVAQIAASLIEFGWTNPILVDGEGGVIAGHGRLLAARRLGLDSVPVVVLGHLTPAQRRAYVILDNRLPLNAGWNEELLSSELHALNGEGFGRFLLDACSNIIAHTDGAIYMCMSSSELHTLQTAFTAAGGHWSTFIIWAKDRFTLGRSDYQRQYEAMLYGWPEGKEHHWCGARDQGDVWFVDRPARNDLHPTMKPVALVERAIRNSSRRGSIVLDPFAGSGTTLIACYHTDRHARLVELDPRYCNLILRRWQEHTGDKAMLADTGQSFDELGETRLSGAEALPPDHQMIQPGQKRQSD